MTNVLFPHALLFFLSFLLFHMSSLSHSLTLPLAQILLTKLGGYYGNCDTGLLFHLSLLNLVG